MRIALNGNLLSSSPGHPGTRLIGGRRGIMRLTILNGPDFTVILSYRPTPLRMENLQRDKIGSWVLFLSDI